MDVLLYCLEMEEMLDYDSLKNDNKKEKADQSEVSRVENLSLDLPSENDKNNAAKKIYRPITRSATVENRKPPTLVKDVTANLVPGPRQRYHPYEEVYIPPQPSAKLQTKPVVAAKPSSEPNGRDANKPAPAPRRSAQSKQPLVTVTDL